MKKNIFDMNRLPKQAYVKPEMEVMDVDMHVNLLIGSPGSVDGSIHDEIVIDDPTLII